MLQSYLVCEKGSNKPFAVVKDIDKSKISLANSELINKVGLAIEEHNGIDDRVKVIHDSFSIDLKKDEKIIKITFRDADDFEYDVELKETTIY